MRYIASRFRFLFWLFALFANVAIRDADGFCCLPFLKQGKGSLRLFLAAPGYYVYRSSWCSPYIRKATNDDIVDNKYIYINLFSRQHHHAIEATELEDDPDNGRTNMVSYKVNHEKLPAQYRHATIGTVLYYSQILQEYKQYARRSVVTYKDDQDRLCVLIESFDATGERVSMRIFRVKRKMWWMKRVAADDMSVGISLLNVFRKENKSTEAEKQILNIKDSNCPIGMANTKSTDYDIIYNITAGQHTNRIGDIIFRTMPERLSPNTTDLFVWRYFKEGKRDEITYVVIAEVFQDYVYLKYYKCISPKDSHYELIDSFAAEGGYVIPSRERDPYVSLQSEDLSATLSCPKHVSVPDTYIFAYPDSHHYIMRPLSDSKIKVIKEVVVQGENRLELRSSYADGYTFVSFTDAYDAEKKNISLTSIGSRGFYVDGGILHLTKGHQSHALHADQHTVSILKYQIPIHYLGLGPFDMLRSKKAVEFNLEGYLDDEVLAAQVDTTTTFYTPSLYGAAAFHHCTFGSDLKLQLKKSYNTQVMYMEVGGKNMAVVFQAGLKEIGLYEIGDTSIKQYDARATFDFLKKHNMSAYEEITKNVKDPPITYVSLNLNDPIVDRNIETLVISTNVVSYVPSSANMRISSVIWDKEKLSFADSSDPMITIITNNYISYMLVDDVVHGSHKINRYLYAMEFKPDTKLRLIAKVSGDFEEGSVGSIRTTLQNTWYPLIPEKLPIISDAEDKRLGNATFTYNDVTMLFMPYWSEFALGNTNVGKWVVESTKGHRWRQVHSTKQGNEIKQTVYTMMPKGIAEQISVGKEGDIEENMTPYSRLLYSNPAQDSVLLLLDNYSSSDVSVMTSSIGLLTLTTLKPTNGRSFNPVVFGHHEIQLLSGFKCTQVMVSEGVDGLREINLDVITSGGNNVIMKFSQVDKESDMYEMQLDERTRVDFVDLNARMYYYESSLSNLDKIDFNVGNFPHYIRYLTLNPHTIYFTGYTMATGLEISYGPHKTNIPHAGASFHIWIRYPYKDTKTSMLYVQYNHNGSTTQTLFSIEDAAAAKELRLPSYGNCNWGPMSNMEFYTVNSVVARRALVSRELEAVNLDLSSSKRDARILKLKVDDATTLYTTLATSRSVIDSVEYKGVIIKGVPKQVVKHVYYSHSQNDDIILVVVHTVKSVVAKAYRFTPDNTFESVDHLGVDAGVHTTIHNVLTSIA
ncbi:hypothetical protein X943_001135 [Babesia divergens]|uniref:Uncharacterized protein n=1 Tax=Babesia divergens TaxID=32595 RepID=A0AAD9GF98_BABDI|nr:hypothetical protein X943_001135 [Babesia divergens]